MAATEIKPSVDSSAQETGSKEAMDDAALGGSRSQHDANDMLRLGKKQEYNRNFRLMATVGFASIFTSTWEFALCSTSGSLINGGLGGLFWQYVWTFFGALTVVLSLAEMSSMAPTAGGQYHWTSEFAPARYQRIFSYIAGWTSTIAWQPALAGGLYPVVTMIESLRSYQDSDFAFTNWQASLLMIALGLLTIPFNTVWRKALPAFESVVLVFHFLGFFITIGVVWALAPRNSAKDVFTSIVNSGGWSNTGLSMLVGQVSAWYTMAGADSAVHLSEEVEDASMTIPRSIVWSFLINSAMGFVMIITMLFAIGDLEDAIETAEPFVNVFFNAGGAGPATALTVILLFLLIAGNNTCTTTESRQMWAFARDQGLPGSTWLSKIDAKWNVPLNCIWITMAINIVLCLINLGSNYGFNVIISLQSTGFLATYLFSIGCLISARLRGDKLPPARWSLGRLGLPINIVAVVYSVLVFIFTFFPVEVPVTLDTMNWVVVIFPAVVLLSVVYYVFVGHTAFKGPVAYVEGKRESDVLQSVDGDVRF